MPNTLNKIIPEENDSRKKLLATSLKDFDLSVRATNALKATGIETLEDVIKKTRADLLEVINFGKKSLNELEEVLRQKGLSLKKKSV